MTDWRAAVVRVWDGLPGGGGKFVGTAFFINVSTLLTAKHVVENYKQNIYLEGAPGGGKDKIEPGNIIFCERDIAILRTSHSFSTIPSFRITFTQFENGQKLTFAGYIDETQELHVLTSEISGHVSAIDTWRTQGNISRGMSGGPAIDEKGDIVGIIQARDADKNLSYLIPSDVINLCLDQTGSQKFLPKAPLYNVPSLPPHYMERSEHADKIISLLLKSAKNVGITGISHAVGLQGMGGIGKSILAAAVAYDNRIRTAFPDGIVWVALGQKPDITNAQNRISENFDEVEISPETPWQGKSLLNKLFSDKKILLILDDVWDIKDIQYFDISSTESRLLVTTRHAQVLRGIGAEECKIDVLSTEQSLQLLRVQSNWTEDVMPEEAKQIVKESGALPLAISMIGAMLRDKPQNRWGRVLKHLQNAELKNIRQQFANYPYPDLFVALHVSVEAQSSLNQKCYLELAVFAEDTPIPESVLEIYWDKSDLQGLDATDIIDELLDASLIFRYNESSLILHDLQRDYIQSQCPNIQWCHKKIINAYERNYPGGWHTIPHTKPSYFYKHFVEHLRKAEDKEKAQYIAENLLYGKSDLSWNYVLTFAEVIRKPLAQVLSQILKTSNNYYTLSSCLRLVGDNAKEDAKRLLNEHQEPEIIIGCLRVLGNDAKEDAHRLLKERSEPGIVIACLNLLGNEAKEDAHRLLKERSGPGIVIACLNLLGNDAKEDARRLLKERSVPGIVIACLNLLGNDAKEDAHRLLKESQESGIVIACLNLLGNEAKEDALDLLKECQNEQVILACLNLSGSKAKEDARRFLKENHHNEQIILACLSLLGSEAKEDALHLLKQGKILRPEIGIVEKQRYAQDILYHWKTFPRFLVTSALIVFDSNPSKVTEYCRSILENWEHEMECCIDFEIPKYSMHIIKSLAHPELKNAARLAAFAILKKEEEIPGFVDELLLEYAQEVANGESLAWNDTYD